MDKQIKEDNFSGKLLIKILIILTTKKHGRTKLKWKNRRKRQTKYLVQVTTKKQLRSLGSAWE